MTRRAETLGGRPGELARALLERSEREGPRACMAAVADAIGGDRRGLGPRGPVELLDVDRPRLARAAPRRAGA
jgi:hypothetical protein